MVRKNGLIQTGVSLFLCGMVLLLFYRFTTQNSERIEEQNRIYAADAARQAAISIDEQFRATQEALGTYAYFLERTLDSAAISPELLAALEKRSTFDAVRFTGADGRGMASDGTITDTSDRDYYRLGMEGKSGVSVIFNSSIFGQTTLGFYTPLRVGGRIIGVLHGSYLAGNYLRGILTVPYFGMTSDIFLCAPDGRIIATSAEKAYSGHIIDALLQSGMIGQPTAEGARKVFRDGGEGTFACAPGSGTDNLCVMHLPQYDFFLVQTFPRSVTQGMVRRANMAGVQLEISLLVLFACYAAFMLIRAHRQKKRLERENREFGYVIRGMNTLFSGLYILADLETKRYERIAGGENAERDPDAHGAYADLLRIQSGILVDDEAREKFRGFFALDSLRERLARSDSLSCECHVRRGGKEGWENINAICLERRDGVATKVLFVHQDVTELKNRELQTQKKLSAMDRKERQYRLAVTSNALCTYEFNVSRDRVEEDIIRHLDDIQFSMLEEYNLHAPCRVSDAFAAWLPTVLPESREEYSRVMSIGHLRERFAAGEKEVGLDYWCTDPRGGEVCVRQSFYLTEDDITGDVMAMSVARDITEQVTKQRLQTKALRDALIQAQHANAAKTTFLSNMSHDIRTPMNAVIGFATIAASHLDNREQVRDCLQKVLSSSNHLLSLINDILDMSRIESGKLQIKEQECNISELMHNLVNIIQPQVKAKRLQMFIDTFEVTNEDVITDPLKLNQIFINLLSNAVKYTPAGGSITFSIHQAPAFRHGYADFVFEVRDSGIGMSAEFVRHIFEPFTRETTTTLSGIQGTGLGMAITKNIIEIMNGRIEVESAPGKGSAFTVHLTLKLQETQSGSDIIQELSGMRVLVVDDDFHVCDSVDKMLKKIGLRSEWTTSGREAAYRAQIAHNDNDPYLTYIIDWQMPDMNGVETARSIRRAVGKDAPIIILTAYEWTDIEEEARSAGVTAFCAKPLFMSDLRHALISSHKLQDKGDEPREETPDFGGRRILLVDDVEMNRELAEFILVESGFVVESAPDGSDAVEMVRKSPEGYYDAILMDVQMPTMDGYEATRAIRGLAREDVKTLPIIAMTANAMEEDKEAALKNGMNAHIAKPLDIDLFMKVLAKYLGR